jgi:hypothetical protein
MMGEASQELFLPMAVGFAIAVALIVGALLQDPLMAVVRWTAAQTNRHGRRVLGATWRAAARGVAGSLRAVGRAGAAARRTGSVGVPRTRRPAARTATTSIADSAIPASLVVDDEPTGAEYSDATDAALNDESEQRNERATHWREDAIGEERRRFSRPSSSVHVYEVVQELFREADQVTADGLVRHLNRHFGTGRGVPLMESLVRRKLLVIRRNPRNPTQMILTLGAEPGPGAVPSGSDAT